MLEAMESFSVENLQALVICAFDIVSDPIFISNADRLTDLVDRDWAWTISLVNSGQYVPDC